jgi:ABC-type transport system involved in cytochrome c biogenesis permease subunit
MSGVSTICFAASYAIAFALEVSRLWFRSSVRSVVLFGFAGAGFFAHTAFLYYRAVHADGAPLSSEKDWYLMAAWALAAVYLYLAALYPQTPFGLFLLPLSLAFIGAATFLAKQDFLANGPALHVWGAIHGLSIMAAAVSVLIGFMAGVMYFVQARQLKHKRMPGRNLRLPSLEWLQRANSRAIGFSVGMLSIGVAAGWILNRIHLGSDAPRLPWFDPVVLSTFLLLVWLVVAEAVSVFYRPARQGRKVAYLTVASFIFLVIVLAVGLLFSSRHWDRDRNARENSKAPAVRFEPSLSSREVGGLPC